MFTIASMKKDAVKTTVAALLALVFLALAYWYLVAGGGAEKGGGVPRPPAAREAGGGAVAVEVAPVVQGEIVERRAFTGSLDPASRFQLASRVSGRLLALSVDLGDLVRRGQVVATLDNEEYLLVVARAEAELAVAEAGLSEAESSLAARARELAQMQQLRGQGVAAEAELESALADHQVQRARVAMAAAMVNQRRAALNSDKLRLSYTEIRADWLGGDEQRVIAERLVDAGTLLAANDPVFTVVGIDRLVAVGYVPERDYANLRLGQAVMVSADAIPGRQFPGTLARLAPVIRESSRQARLEVDLANPGQVLKPGMFVRLEIELARKGDAVLVPREALVERNGDNAIFLADLEAGLARRLEVRLGLQERERVEVLEPPITGQVVTLGQHLLSDGARIIVPGSEVAKGGPAGRRPGDKKQ